MKRIFCIVFFMAMVSIASFAQNSLDIEGGYIPRASAVDWSVSHPELQLTKDVFYLDLTTRISILKYGFVGGSATTWMVLNDDNGFMFPFYMSYIFNAGLVIDNFEIGYWHRCSHPMATLGYAVDPLFSLDSTSDKIYAKLSFKF